MKSAVWSYFFTTHFFISLIAVLLSVETAILFQHSFRSLDFYLFVFFSTLFSYNIYYVKGSNAKMFWRLSLFAFCFMLFYFLKLKLYFDKRLLLLCFLSFLYILPVFLNLEKNKNFTIQKLILLISIWVFCTFFLPLHILNFNYFFFVMLLYRVAIMSFSCLLFFIRDEKNQKLKQSAQKYCNPLIGILILLSLLIVGSVEWKLGLIYFFISILCIFLNKYFLKKERTKLDYLIFADGILALQSLLIFILLK